MVSENPEDVEFQAEASQESEEQSCQNSESEEIGSFPARLRQAIGDKSIRAFARECGFSDSVLRQYLSGQSEPTRPALIAIARTAGVQIAWLVSGQVPDLSARYECVEDESDLLFAKSFVKKKFGSTGLLKQNYMYDESMEPTIQWGDPILVDTGQREPSVIGHGIYMMYLFRQILVKRVQRISPTQLRIISDNPIYPSFIVEQDYLKQNESLLGRVILYARPLIKVK